jgi:hypothetical protein
MVLPAHERRTEMGVVGKGKDTIRTGCEETIIRRSNDEPQREGEEEDH